MDSLQGFRILRLFSCNGVARPVVEGIKEPPGADGGGGERVNVTDRRCSSRANSAPTIGPTPTARPDGPRPQRPVGGDQRTAGVHRLTVPPRVNGVHACEKILSLL